MSNISEPKTLNEWILRNKQFYEWYYKEYPFLKEIGLPIPFETLQDYYKTDIENRNFSVNYDIYYNYSFVFSYFLENFPKSDSAKFKGKTFIEYVGEETKNQIENIADIVAKPFELSFDFLKNINKNLPLIIITVGLFFLWKTKN